MNAETLVIAHAYAPCYVQLSLQIDHVYKIVLILF